MPEKMEVTLKKEVTHVQVSPDGHVGFFNGHDLLMEADLSPADLQALRTVLEKYLGEVQ
jgi:hypothetical protein